MEPAHLHEVWDKPGRTHLGVLEPQGLEAGRVQLLTAAPCLDHLLPHKGGDQVVKLSHRWSFRHPCRQKWGKEATDFTSSSLAFLVGAKFQAFKQLFFCHRLEMHTWPKGGVARKRGQIKEKDQLWLGVGQFPSNGFPFQPLSPSSHLKHLLSTNSVLSHQVMGVLVAP